MGQYYQKLKYYAGEIPVLGGDYLASECGVGINLNILQPPHLTQFVLLPNAAYFEFLPFNLDEETDLDAREIVDISSLEVGKMNEVVVSTYRGFYRYRLGYIVRVVGFHNSSPVDDFLLRLVGFCRMRSCRNWVGFSGGIFPVLKMGWEVFIN